MAGECDRPKKEDPPPKGHSKGDSGKSEKGKTKGKADDGKGTPLIKQVGEVVETTEKEQRELKSQTSDPKEPDAEPREALSEFEKTVVKTLKDKGTPKANPNSIDVDSIVDVLKQFQVNKIKAIRIKKVGREDKKIWIA